MNKKDLSERDICSKFVGPAIKRAGWDGMMQIREEANFTKGRIIVRGKLVTRGKAKRADYILYYKPNIPIAIVEAKDNNHSVGDGMQQALDYAVTLNIPFVFSSNGDGYVFHDRTGTSMEKEATLSLDAFPSPKDLWDKYRTWKGLTRDEEAIVLQDYFEDGSGKGPRYYQQNAINAAIEARNPVYTYSLRQGIEDGFLAPYKVVEVHIDVDVHGYRPERGDVDRDGDEIEDRIYNTKDFDRTLVIDDRTKLVAKKVSDFLRKATTVSRKPLFFAWMRNMPPGCGRL
jgi:type I site-specific restriction endonuclease